MDEFYKKDIINLLENNYINDLERLKTINSGIDYILNNIKYNIQTEKDQKNYNKITSCFLTINKIIKEEEKKEGII